MTAQPQWCPVFTEVDRAISCVVTVKEQSIRGRCTVQLPGEKKLIQTLFGDTVIIILTIFYW